MDDLDFLDGPSPAEPTAAVETPAPQQEIPANAEPPEGPPRGPDGKFVSKAPEPAQTDPAPAPQSAEPVAEQAKADPAKAPDGYVPLAALQELRREFSAFKQSVQAPPQPAPDPYEDFEAYQAWQQNQVMAERAQWSLDLAIARHGEDRANEVRAWAEQRFASDPIFAQRAMSARDPYSVAFDEWRREQVFSRFTEKPELFETLLALASGQAAATTAAPAAPSPQTPTPPRSLAAAPNAGGGRPGAVFLDDEAVFDQTIR